MENSGEWVWKDVEFKVCVRVGKLPYRDDIWYMYYFADPDDKLYPGQQVTPL